MDFIALNTESDQLKEAVEKLISLGKDSVAYSKLIKNSLHGKYGCFQLVRVINDEGFIKMKIGAFYFKSEVDIKNLIGEAYLSDLVKLYGTVLTATFNEARYASIREEIRSAIQNVRAKNIESINF